MTEYFPAAVVAVSNEHLTRNGTISVRTLIDALDALGVKPNHTGLTVRAASHLIRQLGADPTVLDLDNAEVRI